MKRKQIFGSAVLAGVCIAIGGTAFLSLENKVLGAFFFTAGLFTICTFGLHLFTGKVCYVFEKGKNYVLDLPVIWVGNLVGTWAVAALERCTRTGEALTAKAADICSVKLNDQLLSVFILAVLCNVLIYIAVEGYGKSLYEIGKYLSLFLGVMVFILCSFEHCVANMYYFLMAGAWSGKTLLYLLVMTLGNAMGGIIFPLLRGWMKQE